MRIALLTSNLQPDNGWATLAVRRGEALMRLGVEVVALTRVNDTAPVGIAPTTIHRVLPSRLGGMRAILDLVRLNGLVRRMTAGCNLLDAVAEPMALACALTASVRPLIVTACGSYVAHAVRYSPARPVYRPLFRRAHIHAISAYTAARVGEALRTAPPPVILPGVEYEAYQTPRARPEKRGPTVLCVGAVKPRKGIHVLIEAMALVIERIPDARCVIIGALNRERYIARLRERIDALGLRDHVDLLGYLPDEQITGWYQTADVFALPSLNRPHLFEGFGLVHLEANACGLPAIGTRDNGSESAILDGETGYLVAQNDALALAERIVAVLGDTSLRARLSASAREFARAHTWDASARSLLDYYEKVVSSRAHPDPV